MGAHPDDGVRLRRHPVAKWAATSTEASIVIGTDGSKGTWDPRADLTALVARREA